jgi:hypothetical protein
MTSILGRLGECLAATALVAAVALGNAATAEAKPRPTTTKFDAAGFGKCIENWASSPSQTLASFYAAIQDCCMNAGGNPIYDYNATAGTGGASCPEAEAAGLYPTPPQVPSQQSTPPPVLGPSATSTKPAPPVGQGPTAPSRQ